MELKLIRQLWGIDKPWDNVFQRIRTEGFDGVEIAIPSLDPFSEYESMLSENQLECVPMIFTEGDSVDAHIESFRSQLKSALRFKPILITCHDGKDAFTDADAIRYYSAVLEIEADLGARVAHETHRGRILYNPWTTSRLLDQFPALQLCCDFSHWVCVCERLIDDQLDIIRQCAQRTLHVHARVGYNEGPQVPDPRVDQYKDELEAHERWWDIIWDSQAARGMTVSTLTPEFGPPPYMQTDPSTGRPISDLWEVSNWIAHRQAKRFASRQTA